MLFLYLLAFFLLCAAALSFLRVSPADLLQDGSALIERLRPQRKLSLKQQIKQSVREKKIRGIRKILTDSRNVLVLTHRTDRLRWYMSASMILFVAGILIGTALKNLFLIPVLAVGLALLPWLSILLSVASYQKQLNEELETTLSMITTSYLRSDNIIESIRENSENIHYPIKEIFDKFLIQADLISSDITQLLEEMKDSLDNTVWRDWVDQIILCRQNRTLKGTLQPIVSRLSNVREVSGNLDNNMYDPIKEFVSMAVLNVLNFPLLRMMYPDWYYSLTEQTGGQILTAAVFAVVFVSLCACVTKTRPVEYRR